jgi:hypothetical protein
MDTLLDLPVTSAPHTRTVRTDGVMQFRGFLMSSRELVLVSTSKRAREESGGDDASDTQVPAKIPKVTCHGAGTQCRIKVSQDGTVPVSMSSSCNLLL